MLIRMTEDTWINFDNVEKIVALDGVLKVFYDGYNNEGTSFQLDNKDEAEKVLREISFSMAAIEIASSPPEDVKRRYNGPAIKSGKFNEGITD